MVRSPTGFDRRRRDRKHAVVSDFSLTPDIVNEAVRHHWADTPHLCTDIGPRHAMATQVINQENLRPGGFVPGPTMFSMADVVLWYLSFGTVNRIEPMALTSDLSIRFLRPAQGQKLWARADLDKAGRLMVVGTVKIWVDDAPDRRVATAQGTYVMPQR